MDSASLISRKRHYFYVLVFSVAVWVFFAMLVGGFVPFYFKIGQCECQLHESYLNIGVLLFLTGGIVTGIVFSYPLHRLMLVAHSKHSQNNVPISWVAHRGQLLLGWQGIFVLVLMAGAYIAAFIAGSCIIGDYSLEEWNMYRNTTALHCAIIRGDIADTCDALEDIDINKLDRVGRTPLSVAIRHWNTDIFELLLRKGADVNLRDGMNMTPLMDAVDRAESPPPIYDYVTRLIGKGANINAETRSGETALDIAQNWKNKKAIELLRSHSAKTGEELKKEAGE
ncbi:MAG: ankyrin repeat domain-containing protein [Planctomycetota bacterium]|nr:MAG: ankyrin repeat domain-containing protein [Planctomycetota bacterium]